MRTDGAKTTDSRGGRTHLGTFRRLRAVVLVTVLTSSNACFRYVELSAAQPMEAQRVEFQLNDAGRLQLQRALGPGARSVEGRVNTQTAETYSVAVYRITNVRGESFTWSGEEVQLPVTGVESAMRREVDKGRSVLAVAAFAGAVAVFALTRSLFGGGQQPGDVEVPPVQSVR